MVRSFGSLTTRGVDDAITKELNDNTGAVARTGGVYPRTRAYAPNLTAHARPTAVPEYDLVADLNAKNPGTTIRWCVFAVGSTQCHWIAPIRYLGQY
jgi:hypothetical protein